MLDLPLLPRSALDGLWRGRALGKGCGGEGLWGRAEGLKGSGISWHSPAGCPCSWQAPPPAGSLPFPQPVRSFPSSCSHPSLERAFVPFARPRFAGFVFLAEPESGISAEFSCRVNSVCLCKLSPPSFTPGGLRKAPAQSSPCSYRCQRKHGSLVGEGWR